MTIQPIPQSEPLAVVAEHPSRPAATASAPSPTPRDLFPLLPPGTFRPFDCRTASTTVERLRTAADRIHELDLQDRANAEAALIAGLRDESRDDIDFARLARDYFTRMEKHLIALPVVDQDVLAERSLRALSFQRNALHTLLFGLAQRTLDRRRMKLEAGLAGTIRWYGRRRCIHTYARLVGRGSVLSEDRRRVGRRMFDRKTGKEITWAQRAWNGRRGEDTYTSKKEIEVDTAIETNTHSLVNAARRTLAEALDNVPMPERIRLCIEMLDESEYRDLYYVAVGDLHDASVERRSLGRGRTTVESTWKNVWYACEPALVFAPLGIVEAGWLDEDDD